MKRMKDLNNNNTLVRLVIMLVVMANSIGTMYGYSLIPYTEEEISQGISVVALVVSELWNHWKNNNYTDVAKKTQKDLEFRKKFE